MIKVFLHRHLEVHDIHHTSKMTVLQCDSWSFSLSCIVIWRWWVQGCLETSDILVEVLRRRGPCWDSVVVSVLWFLLTRAAAGLLSWPPGGEEGHCSRRPAELRGRARTRSQGAGGEARAPGFLHGWGRVGYSPLYRSELNQENSSLLMKNTCSN